MVQRYDQIVKKTMNPENFNQESEFFEKVVQVNRVSKKTQGGDKRSLSVLAVVGDKKGRVGVGLGKAGDVQSAVRKATGYARRHLVTIPLYENRTIPHSITVKRGAARVMLRPAPAGTGIIAGGAVRVVVEAAGISDVVSKILGTSNQASNVYATMAALGKLKMIGERMGGKKTEEKSETAKAKKEKQES